MDRLRLLKGDLVETKVAYKDAKASNVIVGILRIVPAHEEWLELRRHYRMNERRKEEERKGKGCKNGDMCMRDKI